MFRRILEIVSKEISGENAKGLATDVTQFHRIEISPHFREAALWCQKQLRTYGLHTELLKFRADGNTMYWSFLLPEEWKVESAIFKVEDIIWAQWKDQKLSLIQRSSPVDVEAEIISIETDEEAAFKKVEGKIVYSPLPLERVAEPALHYGAKGLILSGVPRIPMRTFFDISDILYYFSFNAEKGSGFVISPEKALILRKILKEKPVKAKMVIKSFMYPGYVDVIDAFIPGKTEEEVLVVAHLCHPQPSANDNASGVGTIIEVARTLHTLIENEKLEKPKRSIRFLLVPEIIGIVAYLASNQEKIPVTTAGINLDMVGSQGTLKSPLLLERTPDALPSFVNDLAEIILEELDSESGTNPQTPVSVKPGGSPLSGRSDHLVLSDPSVGIPCPLVFHWPDVSYHSSLDTADKLDPVEMEKAGKLAAAYTFFIASAGRTEVEWLAAVMCRKAKERISKEVIEILKDFDSRKTRKEIENEDRKKQIKKAKYSFSERLDYFLERELLSLRSVKRLGYTVTEDLEKELIEFVDAQKKRIPAIEPGREGKGCASTSTCSWIPKRIYRGPISMRKTLLELPYKERRVYGRKMDKYRDVRFTGDLAVYWSDGKRTLSHIARLITYEIGKSSLEFLKWYFEFLQVHGLIELKK